MKISIGLTDAGRKAIAESLVKVLADTYALALKTQNYHWNVTGPSFAQYHAMFEEQYTALYAAGDEVAVDGDAQAELIAGGAVGSAEAELLGPHAADLSEDEGRAGIRAAGVVIQGHADDDGAVVVGDRVSEALVGTADGGGELGLLGPVVGRGAGHAGGAIDVRRTRIHAAGVVVQR